VGEGDVNPLLAAVVLIVLHNVDGDEIFINPEHIVALYPTKESKQGGPNQLITGGVNCVVTMDTGKFMSVIESCSVVRKQMEDAR
jgi:hypothetical protein